MGKIPRRSAGPKQVRTYLIHTLVHKHDVTSEIAQATANLWKFGRSDDLRKSSKMDFVRVFGKEIGPFLYASVDEDKYAEWRASTSGIINYWAMIIACVAAAFFLFRAFYSPAHIWKNVVRAYLVWGPTFLICAGREYDVRDGSLQFGMAIVGMMSNFFAPIILGGLWLAKKHQGE
ncbi:uncharacterized protein N7498_006006 [Penicillium cinerascens]|uniref:Uncharacterized protein n=1 Tax=Penicillium cinerascens TaxID=70096 RepID=A0A9W9MHG3_9EURO|nr:uncharacterized protein N7498_006006 [Penicillium cinerascens]KAJ5201343.1 hypothetical protein N7498_006006 [Penicillium cinerascens]